MNLKTPMQLVVANRLIEFSERPEADDERRLYVTIDYEGLATIELLPYYTPGFAISGPRLAVWGGCRLFVVDSEARTIERFDRDDEVHVVYPVDQFWCLRGEITVTLLSLSRGVEAARYSHNEVITQSWWEGSRLWLRDFDEKIFALEIKDGCLSVIGLARP